MIVQMTAQNRSDYKLQNDGFMVMGKLVVKFDGDDWTYTEQLLDNAYYKSYENDVVDESYINNPNKVVFFFYDRDQCVGQLKLSKNWNGYGLIEDIGIVTDFRQKGIGSLLLKKAIEWAKEHQLIGLTLETQDVNVQACRFYAKNGFVIGAVDTKLYANFDTKNEKAILWYYLF